MSKIKGKPDVTAFLNGGKADAESRLASVPEPAPAAPEPAPPSPSPAPVPEPTPPSPEPAPPAPEPKPAAEEKPVVIPKRQKLVELPEPLFHALKDRAYEEYKRTGKRVTETELIIAALKQYLNV